LEAGQIFGYVMGMGMGMGPRQPQKDPAQNSPSGSHIVKKTNAISRAVRNFQIGPTWKQITILPI
jgi:hypothetical protein